MIALSMNGFAANKSDHMRGSRLQLRQPDGRVVSVEASDRETTSVGRGQSRRYIRPSARSTARTSEFTENRSATTRIDMALSSRPGAFRYY